MSELERKILNHLDKIEESFTYLGVLKDLPLMESMQLFDNAFERFLNLAGRIWDNKGYLDRKELFDEIGEDYNKIKNLIHANDALSPIYNGFRAVYKYLEQLNDQGATLEEGREKIQAINNSRKK